MMMLAILAVITPLVTAPAPVPSRGPDVGPRAIPTLQTSLRSYALARVEFTGLRRLSAARVLAMTGLRENTMVTQRDVETASARLLDSGLFLSVSHRYRMARYSLVVTFVLEEATWGTPIVFDNFTGYSDEELTRAIARRVPFFDGHAPESPTVLNRIATAARDFVRQAAPGATVDYVLVSESKGVRGHYRFSLRVPGRSTPICGLELEGFTDDQLTEARQKSASLVGSEYSHDMVEQQALRNLLPIWRREGRYLARVAALAVNRTGPGDSCGDGVKVGIKVDPGRYYIWKSFEWPGTAVMTSEELRRAVGVEAGEPADEDLLDERLAAVAEQYHRRGYLAAQVNSVKQVDEARGTVTCQVAVFEGPRFRFRNLELVGIEADIAARIRQRWSLNPGAFYDGYYAREFLKQVREAERSALAGRTVITIRERPDGATGTVDVVLEFGR